MQLQQTTPGVIRTGEVAVILGVSRQSVHRLAQRGAIPFQVIPGLAHRRFRVEDVQALKAKGWSGLGSTAGVGDDATA